MDQKLQQEHQTTALQILPMKDPAVRLHSGLEIRNKVHGHWLRERKVQLIEDVEFSQHTKEEKQPVLCHVATWHLAKRCVSAMESK